VLERSFSSPTRILLLVLPDPPPVAVRGRGRLPIHDAILEQLEVVHARAQDPPPLGDLVSAVDRRCAWTTWTDIDRILLDGVAALTGCQPRRVRADRRDALACRAICAQSSLSCGNQNAEGPGPKPGALLSVASWCSDHLRILVTRPAPTVRPPSRMANLSSSSMAIGWIS
jgi:hypothetical protein